MKKIDKKEVEVIRVLNSLGYNDQNIADLIGRSRMTIVRYRTDMGLRANTIHTRMSERKKAISLRKTMEQQTAGHMNYAKLTNIIRAASIGWPDYQLSEALILYTLHTNGPLETPEILERIRQKKTQEDWRPHVMTHNKFCCYVSSLNKSEMIKTLPNPKRVPDRRKLPRIYDLTEKAREEIEQRVSRKPRLLEEKL